MAEFVIRQANGAIVAAVDGYISPIGVAPPATKRRPVRVDQSDLIEQIAAWVQGDGTDDRRMALADGIRERRFMPKIAVGPAEAKFLMVGDSSRQIG